MKRCETLRKERDEYIRRVVSNAHSTSKAVMVLSRRLYLSERRIWHIVTEATGK